MNIRKAAVNVLNGIVSIYDEIHEREENGETTTGWIKKIYPVWKTAEESIARRDMFVQEDASGAITATGIINQTQVDVYKLGKWRYPASDREIMVLHTLVVSVRPGHRGSGRELLRFYEEYARQHGCKYLTPKGIPAKVLETLFAYYLANKPEDSDWVMLPLSSFDAYFGTISSSHLWLAMLPKEIIQREQQSYGICRYRIAAPLFTFTDLSMFPCFPVLTVLSL